MSQSNGTANGRDEKGRFSRGNTYGKGNPFARQTAQLRKAFVDMVSEQDVRDIVAVLMLKAKSGDLAAAKLVLSYTIGRPAEAENPDRLDADEWSAWSSRMTDPRQVQEWLSGAPLDYFNKVAPILLDVQTQSCADQYNHLWQQKHPEEYEQFMQRKAKEQEPDPSANGDDGDTPVSEPVASATETARPSDPPPSGYGGNGAGPRVPVGKPRQKSARRQQSPPSTAGHCGTPNNAKAPSPNGDGGRMSGQGEPPTQPVEELHPHLSSIFSE